MIDLIFALIELFSLSITFPGLRMKQSVHSSAVFTGVRPVCNQILPINHSYYGKTRNTGLPDGEDCIPLRSLVFTQYRSVTDSRRRDGEICRIIYSACSAARYMHSVHSIFTNAHRQTEHGFFFFFSI